MSSFQTKKKSTSNSNIWPKRTSGKKKAKQRTSSEILTLTVEPEIEHIVEEETLRSRNDIFTYFFNALIADIIWSKEETTKTVELGRSSDIAIEYYNEAVEDEDDDFLPPSCAIEKRLPPTPSIASAKRHVASYDPFKEKPSTTGGSYAKCMIFHKLGEKQSIQSSMFRDEDIATESIVVERIVFKNGNIYEGSCNEYLMHGNGTFTWSDNTVYKGEFLNGFITGKGTIVLPDLSKYEGDFCQGTFHGSGLLNILSTSVYYYGNWKNGKKHGDGWVMYESGDWYEGDWYNDLRHGVGYRRYKNGAKYKGDWVANKKQGKGKILLDNNDYYNGEWFDDKPHGYGEYTWDLKPNEAFCFPLYNSYRGSWKNGERDGLGIMNFGTECGAKYAGIWSKNSKHGPGVMICGNGLMLESNPLFEFNKPVHKSSQKSVEDLNLNFLDGDSIGTDSYIEKVSYYEILKMVDSKVAYDEIDEAILINITRNGSLIPPFMFVKLLDTISGSKKNWSPLVIPTHGAAEDVNFMYFIDIIFDYSLKHARTGDFMNMRNEMQQSREENIRTKPSLGQKNCNRFRRSLMSYTFSFMTSGIGQSAISILSAKCRSPINKSVESRELSCEQQGQLAVEEEVELFRNVILVHLPKLHAIYNKYASLAVTQSSEQKEINYKPVMIRMFLWQLFRDANVHDGVQISEVDSLLWENPQSCLETDHYAFEPIYFYQFLQYLMGCAWLIFAKKLEENSDMKLMYPSQIFKDFLELNFFGKVDPLTGSALGEYLNLIPIKKMYNLYASISEPMSVKTFFKVTFRNEKERLPCFAAVSSGIVPKLVDGYNVVPIGHDVCYVQIPDPLVGKRNQFEEPVENFDPYSRSMLTFRSLGKKKLTECLVKVCPKIMKESNVDMNYNLTFLEFYEVIIKCAFIKAEELLKEQECRRAILLPKITSTERQFLGESASKRDKLNKKKKFKKSTITIGILPSATAN